MSDDGQRAVRLSAAVYAEVGRLAESLGLSRRELIERAVSALGSEIETSGGLFIRAKGGRCAPFGAPGGWGTGHGRGGWSSNS